MPLLNNPAVQLYTVRDSLSDDPKRTLERLAAIGYRQVEPYNVLGFADALRDGLPAAGLSAPSTHARLLDDNHKETLETAAKLGIGTVIDPMIDPTRWETRDGIARIVDDLAKVAADAREFGLCIGYHNHAFELSTRIDDTSALEVFAALLPPEIILEVDTYWAAVGGEDAPSLLERLGEKVRFLHIKDGPINKTNTEQVAVGSGRMPVAAVIEAVPHLEAGVVELDGYDGDVWTAVQASYDYLVGER